MKHVPYKNIKKQSLIECWFSSELLYLDTLQEETWKTQSSIKESLGSRYEQASFESRTTTQEISRFPKSYESSVNNSPAWRV